MSKTIGTWKIASAALLVTGVLAISFHTWISGKPRSVAAPDPALPEDQGGAIALVDESSAWGVERYIHTFGVACVDIDDDGDDDLVVSNHHAPPSLLLNERGSFRDVSALYPTDGWSDRHGISVVDADSDGDRDLIVAAGGADGIGAGSPNEIVLNRLRERGALAFERLQPAGFGLPRWRSRHLMPLASPNGRNLDLYLVGLPRERPGGRPTSNVYFHVVPHGDGIRMARRRGHGLEQRFFSEGKDLFFDYDRDGDRDLLVIDRGRARLLEATAGGYRRRKSSLTKAVRVSSAAVADVDNDGDLDVYLGTHSRVQSLDNASATATSLQFVVHNQPGDRTDHLRFRTDAETIHIDFSQHLQWTGKTRTDSSDLFVGRNGGQVESRITSISAQDALGKPRIRDAGTYIWFEPVEGWNLLWRHRADMPLWKGKLRSKGIRDLRFLAWEGGAQSSTEDLLFLNEGGREFRRVSAFSHSSWTESVTAVDLDNDGFVEFVGVRHNAQGLLNGEPFCIRNHGGVAFRSEAIMENAADDAYQADMVVHGFFDEGGLPDIFFTNGYGLNPGWNGPYRLFINHTRNQFHYALLKLVGTRALRDALGAQVELRDEHGMRLGYRELGSNFNRSQDTFLVHFGLGSHTGALQAHVVWPGASRPRMYPVAVDRLTVIRQ